MEAFLSKLSWRSRRQLMYLAIPVVPTLLFGAFLTFQYFNTATCSDGQLNQGELGIDCEGPCSMVCPNRIIDPEIIFSDAFPTNPGSYNLAAMFENQNPDLGIDEAKVEFIATGENGEVIFQEVVTIDLRPSSTAVAFVGPVKIDFPPKTVTANLLSTISDWQKYDPAQLLVEPVVISKEIIGTKSLPKAESRLENNRRQKLGKVPTAVVIYGEDNQPIAVSQTIVDFDSGDSQTANYTWPRSFPTSSGVCSRPVDVVLAIDASGSMNSLGDNPPQPLTDVKTAAKNFINLFSDNDQVGIVSFANQGQIVQPLTTLESERIGGINAVSITAEAEVGFTNLADALLISENLLNNGSLNVGRAIIVLTDGLPTAPDDDPNPLTSSINQASLLRSAGVKLFTIGLGDRVDTGFLRQLSGGDDGAIFQTSNASELSVIYSQIATAVCEREPYKIEVFPNPSL